MGQGLCPFWYLFEISVYSKGVFAFKEVADPVAIPAKALRLINFLRFIFLFVMINSFGHQAYCLFLCF
jgi:hypothetical protein